MFNDDKKTELIGETWIALEQIVVPGGGTNDLWHSLNCKGRYAGDIRIELTYYDTRPKIENEEDRRQSAPFPGSPDKASSGLGGSRQPKPVKRRPLPADPTDSSRSSPLPQTPPSAAQNISGSPQRYVESPDDYNHRTITPTDKRFQRLQDEQRRTSPLVNSQHVHVSYNDDMSISSSPIQPSHDMYDQTGQAEYRHSSVPTPSNQSPQNEQFHDQGGEYDDMGYMDDWQPRPPLNPLQNGMVHSNSSPAVIDPRLRQNARTHQWRRTESVIEDEEAPPPPPAHRSIPTSPLNTRSRGNLAGNPSPTVQTHSSPQVYQIAKSPTHSQNHLNQGIPPSLVAGYEHKPMEEDESTMTYERRTATRQQSLDPTLPLSYAQTRSSAAQLRQQPVPQNLESIHGRRGHRYSAPVDQYSSPIPNPRAGSPNRRSPVRKSLSPSPGPTEKAQQSAVPFSPDSFDAYNPSISSASNSGNDPNVRYNTPEKAQEAFRQHERQDKLGDGPIIGSDGRIIDPSDHLPTDTWAPEPEQKTPTRRGPEVTVRFRNSPQGAQPMPPAGRRPLNEARTQSASTPPFAHNAGNGTYYTPTRNRPQQYSRVSPGNVPPPVPSKLPIGGGKEDWGDALSEEMRRIDIGSGRRRGYGP